MFERLFGRKKKDKNKDKDQVDQAESVGSNVNGEDLDEKNKSDRLDQRQEVTNREANGDEEPAKDQVQAENYNQPGPDQEPVKKTSQETEKSEGFFSEFFDGLAKTRKNISDKIDSVLKSTGKVDEELFESLEDILIMSDIGAQTTMDLVDRLRDRVKEKSISEAEDIKAELNSLLKEVMNEKGLDNKLDIDNTPMIILVVGVNGVGKTTSIGKMAKKYKDAGKTVILAAADTFRAAAVDQLQEWANRVGVEMIAGSENADPGSVVYDSIAAAKARDTDILIVDTAGRLHNKKNLMNELNKIYRIIENEYPEARAETLITLDATTGQNAMNQAKEFSEVADISGVILTKMDGTAKGGVVVRIQSELGIPVKYIGLGEGIEDLKEFDTNLFVDSIIS